MLRLCGSVDKELLSAFLERKGEVELNTGSVRDNSAANSEQHEYVHTRTDRKSRNTILSEYIEFKSSHIVRSEIQRNWLARLLCGW
jgi:hypothetical protein